METVAQTLRFTLFHLYRNPQKLDRLRSELREHFNPDFKDDLQLGKLEHLPYLTAVIMEGLRHSPGVVTRLARIAPDRAIDFQRKWRIPPGTPVGMTTLLMHRDESVFDDAADFKPERWLDKNEVREKGMDKCFAPFSRGTRICLGLQYVITTSFNVATHRKDSSRSNSLLQSD